MFRCTFLVLISANLCFSYNTSSVFDKIHVVNRASFESRQSRLISFNTLNDGIKVDLDFSIPFITIPVKKSLGAAQGAVANVNIGALILSGGLVAGITLVLPIILGFFSKQMTYPSSWKKSDPARAGEDPEYWIYIKLMEKLLLSNNLDPTSCMQKLVCSAVSASTTNIKEGKATSSDKIIDGVTSSPWLIDQLQGTPMYFALMDGLNGKKCDDIYTNCNMPKNTIETIVDTFQKFVLHRREND